MIDQNLLLFLGSCGVIATFAWFFLNLGQGAIIAWIASLALLANLLVLKQIELVHLNATASDIYAIGSLFALNLLQEKYGKQAVQQSIWATLGCLIFFAIMSQIHLEYKPSQYDTMHPIYAQILGTTPRLIFGSITTFFLVQQFDAKFYSFLRTKYSKVPVLLVSGISLCCSQFIDTVLFSFIALYGQVGAILEIILISYFIKLLAIANTIPISSLTKKLFAKNL